MELDTTERSADHGACPWSLGPESNLDSTSRRRLRRNRVEQNEDITNNHKHVKTCKLQSKNENCEEVLTLFSILMYLDSTVSA